MRLGRLRAGRVLIAIVLGPPGFPRPGWEITVNGVPRSYRARKKMAIAKYLKSRISPPRVTVRDYDGDEPSIVIKTQLPQPKQENERRLERRGRSSRRCQCLFSADGIQRWSWMKNRGLPSVNRMRLRNTLRCSTITCCRSAV